MKENEIINKAKLGDEMAYSQLYDNYINLIHYYSNFYYLIGFEKEDVIQEGLIGFIKGVQSFNENKKTSFKTFATLCIKRQIFNAIRSNNNIKNNLLNNSLRFTESIDNDSLNYKINDSYFNNTPEKILFSKEKSRIALNLMRKNLSKFEYKILLYLIKGFNYKEISEELEKNIKTIDNAIQRIRRKGKRLLKEDLNH